MAVSVETVARKYLSFTAGTPIQVNFPAYEASDVFVYYGSESLQAVRGTDFTVELAADFNTFIVTPTASLRTKVNALVAQNPSESQAITVRREMNLLTETTPALARGTEFTSREFERVALRDQQLAEAHNRTLSLGPNFVGDAPRFQITELTPGRTLMVNDAGTAIVAGPNASEVSGAQGSANAAAASAAAAALYAPAYFKDRASMIASTTAWAEGQVLNTRLEGAAWVVANPAAVDHHATTAGGRKLYESGWQFSSRARAAQAVGRGERTNGQTVFVNGRRFTVDLSRGWDGLVAVDMSWHGRFEMLQARMMQGDTVRWACFGPSTTDGNGTTGWTANPVDGSQNAIGAAAHDPPNAWPAQMRVALRVMFNNPNIRVWNAGYGARAIVDGWAHSNFTQAVINNPDYGTPDACIVEFGLNDLVRGIFSVETFYSEVCLLLSLFDYYGVVPVLMTPDPVAENTLRSPGFMAKINQVYRRCAEQFGITVIDNFDAMQHLLSGNNRNSLWTYHQPDSLHFGDLGHRNKAMHAAACIYPNTLWLDGDEDVVDVAPWSQFSNVAGKGWNLFKQSELSVNGKFGGTLTYPAGSYALGEALMDVWTYSKCDEYQAFYNSVDGDGYYNPRPRANAPVIKTFNYLSGVIVDAFSQTSGVTMAATGNRPTEEPMFVHAMPGGLSRFQFCAPTDTTANNVFVGFFSFRKPKWPASYAQWIGTGTGTIVNDPDPYNREAPVLGAGYGRSTFAMMDLILPNGAGFAIMSGRVFGTAGAAVDQRRRGLFIVRNGSNLELRDVVFDSASGVIADNVIATGAYAWSETSNLFRVAMGVNGSDETYYQITHASLPLAPIISHTRTRSQAPLMRGGSPGALYKNYTIAAASGIAKLVIFDADIST